MKTQLTPGTEQFALALPCHDTIAAAKPSAHDARDAEMMFTPASSSVIHVPSATVLSVTAYTGNTTTTTQS
jgi:hypothetical protein